MKTAGTRPACLDADSSSQATMSHSADRAARAHLVVIAAYSFALFACGGNKRSDANSTNSASGATPAGSGASAGNTMVRGTVTTVTGDDLVLQTDSGKVQIQLNQPLQIFDRQPATLARLTPNSFIGVTTVKQPDGSDRATEIHVFPEALRGLGEGSRPMTQPGGGTTRNTMTNGSTMANGQSSVSTMSNGSVSGTPGSTIVVQYAGGSKTVSVPPNTTVTEIVPTSGPLTAGTQVIVLATLAPTGSLTSNRVLLAGKTH